MKTPVHSLLKRLRSIRSKIVDEKNVVLVKIVTIVPQIEIHNLRNETIKVDDRDFFVVSVNCLSGSEVELTGNYLPAIELPCTKSQPS